MNQKTSFISFVKMRTKSNYLYVTPHMEQVGRE